MKNIIKAIALFCLISFVIIFFLSCNKKDNLPTAPATYSEIKLNNVKEKATAMSTAPITISNSGGVIWKPGDVFIYKTALGNYGKFEVVSVTISENYKLTIKATTFKADGTVMSSNEALTIRGTWLCDLDATKEAGEDGTEDFKNERLTSTDTEFTPRSGAVFVKYLFK